MKTLINKIKNDDTAAIEQLYQEVKPQAIKVAAQYVGKEDLCEDMFHEAFIKVINNLDKFDEERSFQAWFDVILANTCKSYLRKKKNENLQDAVNDENYEENLEEISDIGNPEECWEQKELAEIISGMLDGLSPEQKEAIILHYYQGASVAEIAEKQNCGEETVKSRLFQGRNKLKTVVEDYEKKQNVKLHSISVVLFVFFKSDMGQAYVCKYSGAVEMATSQGTTQVAKELTKEGGKEAAKQTAKAIAVEAAKTTTMTLGTKLAIGVGVVLLTVAVGVTAIITNKNKQTGDVDETVPTSMEVIQNTEEPATEQSIADTQESVAEATPAPTEEPKNIPDGITVHAVENGIKKLSADINKISFSTANGGTVVTYTEKGCGAIDYDGELLVENGYKYYYGTPDEQGNFMLGDDTTIDVFNAKGEKVHTVKDWWNCYLAEGYVSYSVMDWSTESLQVNCYDIANNMLSTYTIPKVGGFMYCGPVVDGKFITYCWEDGKNMLYTFATDATVVDAAEFSGKPVYGSPNGGYLYCNYTDMNYSEELCSVDGKEKYSLNFVPGYGHKSSYLVDNVSYYNKGKKIVYQDAELGVYYLLDFDKYNASVGTKGCVVAQYNLIRMSETGICYVEDNAGNFYMLEDGTRLEDSYIDRSIFGTKYATVLTTDGKAYMIDTDMNILTQEEIDAEVVSLRGTMPIAEGFGNQTIFLAE